MASIEVGQILDGTVNKIQEYGAFVTLENGCNGLVHISEVSDRYVKSVADVLEVGQKVKVKILDLGDGKKLKLSIKETIPKKNYNNSSFNHNKQKNGNIPSNSFEDILSKFVKDSEEKQCTLNKRNDSRR